nr:hypothetical protein [Pseudomonadota bacterium]
MTTISPRNGHELAAPRSTFADDFWRVTLLAMLIYSLFWMAGLALADLPPAPAAPGGASGSDFIDFFQGYAGQAITTIILI